MDSSQILMLCARLSSIISNKEIGDFDKAVQILWKLYRIVPDTIAVDDFGGLIQNILICKVLSKVANTSIDDVNDATKPEIRDEIMELFKIPKDVLLSEFSRMWLTWTFQTCSQKLILLATAENWDRVQCRDAILIQSDSVWQHISTSTNNYVRKVTETLDQSMVSSTSSVTSKEDSTSCVKSVENSTNFVKDVDSDLEDEDGDLVLNPFPYKCLMKREYCYDYRESKDSDSEEKDDEQTDGLFSTDGDWIRYPIPNFDDQRDGPISSDGKKTYGSIPNNSDGRDGTVANNGGQKNGAIPSNGDPSNGPMTSDSEQRDGRIPSDGDRRNGVILGEGDRRDGPISCDGDQKNGHITFGGGEQTDIPSNSDSRDSSITSDGGQRNGPISSNCDHTNGPIPSHDDPTDGPSTSSGDHRDSSDIPSDADRTYIFQEYDKDITVIPESPRSTCEDPALAEDYESPLLFGSEERKDDIGNGNEVEKDLNTAEKRNNGAVSLASSLQIHNCDKVSDDDIHVMIRQLAATIRSASGLGSRNSLSAGTVTGNEASRNLPSTKDRCGGVCTARWKKPKSIDTTNDCNEVNTNFGEEVINDLQNAQNHCDGLLTKYSEYPKSVVATNNNNNITQIELSGDTETVGKTSEVGLVNSRFVNEATATNERTSNSQDMSLFLDIAASLLNEKEDNDSEKCANVGEEPTPGNLLSLVEENSELWEGTGKKPVDSDFLEWRTDNYEPGDEQTKGTSKPCSDNNIGFPTKGIGNLIEAIDENNKRKNSNNKNRNNDSKRDNDDNNNNRSDSNNRNNDSKSDNDSNNKSENNYRNNQSKSDNNDNNNKSDNNYRNNDSKSDNNDNNNNNKSDNSNRNNDSKSDNDNKSDNNYRNNQSKSDNNDNNNNSSHINNHINEEAENTIIQEAIEAQVPRTRDHIDESQSTNTPMLIDTKDTDMIRNNIPNNDEISSCCTKELAEDLFAYTDDQIYGPRAENCGDGQNNDAINAPPKVTSANKMKPKVKPVGKSCVTEIAPGDEEGTREKTAKETASINGKPKILPNGCSDRRMCIDKKQSMVADLISKLKKLRNGNNLANQESHNELDTDEDNATSQGGIPMLVRERKGKVVGVNRSLGKSRNGVDFSNQILRCDVINRGENSRKSNIPWRVRKRNRRVGVNLALHKIRNGDNLGKSKRPFQRDIQRRFRKKKIRVNATIARGKVDDKDGLTNRSFSGSLVNASKSNHSCENNNSQAKKCISCKDTTTHKHAGLGVSLDENNVSQKSGSMNLKNPPLGGPQKNGLPVNLDEQLNKKNSLKNHDEFVASSPPKLEIKKESTVNEALCNPTENLLPNNNKLECALEAHDRQRSSGQSVTKLENFERSLVSCNEGKNKESSLHQISCNCFETVQSDKAASNTFHHSNSKTSIEELQNERSRISFQTILHDHSYSAKSETKLNVKRKQKSTRFLPLPTSKNQKTSLREQQNSAFIALPKPNVQTSCLQNYSNQINESLSTALPDKGSQQKFSNSTSNVGIVPKKEALNSGNKTSQEESSRCPIDVLNADFTAQSNRIVSKPNDIVEIDKKSDETPRSKTSSIRALPLNQFPPFQFCSSPPGKSPTIEASASSSEDEHRSVRSPSIFELSRLNSESLLSGYTPSKLEWNRWPGTEECLQESSKSSHVVEATKRDTPAFIKKEPVEIDSNLSSSSKDCFEMQGNLHASHEQSTKSKAPVSNGHLLASESLSKNQRHKRKRVSPPVCQCSPVKDPQELLGCPDNGNHGYKRLRVKSEPELNVQSSASRNGQSDSSLSKGTDNNEEQNSKVPCSEGTSSEVQSSVVTCDDESSSWQPSSEEPSSKELSSETSDPDVDDDDDDPSYSDPYTQELSDENSSTMAQSSKKDSSEGASSEEKSSVVLPNHKLLRFYNTERKNSESGSSEDCVIVESGYSRFSLSSRGKRRRIMKRTGNSLIEDGNQMTVAEVSRGEFLMDAVIYLVKLS